MKNTQPLTIPDGRYIIVRGRLWRRANPALSAEGRQALVRQLMSARRAGAVARRQNDDIALRAARATVQQAKEGLGERGPSGGMTAHRTTPASWSGIRPIATGTGHCRRRNTTTTNHRSMESFPTCCCSLRGDHLQSRRHR
jgi:hypothetical protein